ncbi:MAG TPA: hypothetical protein VLA30_11830 [Burkholderiales bacterium]|nr:hypothetical protein [Burkholderiales bacterium]
MTLVDLANIGQMVGALAVVASLIFVGLQVRQNTKATRATALQMNADYWLAYFTLLADKQFSELYSKGALGRVELEGGQFGQFFFLCRATFMGCENQHHQYLSGLLDDDAYRGYEATIREQIAAFPGVRAMWKLVKHTYGTEFVNFLDKQIASSEEHSRGSIQKQWRALIEANADAAKAPDERVQAGAGGAA